MIRSPISTEERLQNRVEALEGRVDELSRCAARLEGRIKRVETLEDNLKLVAKTLYALISMTANGLVETRELVDNQGQEIGFLDGEVGTLLENAGII
jgi:hypothetical protein